MTIRRFEGSIRLIDYKGLLIEIGGERSMIMKVSDNDRLPLALVLLLSTTQSFFGISH